MVSFIASASLHRGRVSIAVAGGRAKQRDKAYVCSLLRYASRSLLPVGTARSIGIEQCLGRFGEVAFLSVLLPLASSREPRLREAGDSVMLEWGGRDVVEVVEVVRDWHGGNVASGFCEEEVHRLAWDR